MTIDSFPVTPGSGRNVGVDTIGGNDFQVVKILLGAEDAIDTVVDSGQQTMANSIPVVIASNQSVVPVAGLDDVLEVTLSTDTAAYGSGDVLADTQEIASAFRANGEKLTITTIVVQDQSDTGYGFDLIFLNAANSLGTENSAPNITDANGTAILGIVPIGQSDWIDLGAFRIATVPNLSLGPIKAAAGSSSLWVGAISRGTGTYAADALRLKISVVRS